MQSAVLPASTAARIGRWWFQRRSVSPLPWFLLMFFLPPEFRLEGRGLALVVIALLATEALRLVSVAFAGSATRTRGDKVPRLVHAGPYRHVRNPLYIANIAMYALCGVLFGFKALAVGVLVYSCIQYTFIVAFEEDLLSRTFGPAYDTYRSRVPRWLPAFSPQVESTGQSFDLRAGLRSERSTILLMATVFAVFAIKRYFFS